MTNARVEVPAAMLRLTGNAVNPGRISTSVHRSRRRRRGRSGRRIGRSRVSATWQHATGWPGAVCSPVYRHRREAGHMAGRDSADFDSFYIATARRVVLYLYAACGDRAEAQDIAQEAYARAWQHWGRVAGYEDPEGWVRQVAWRLMLNRWRSLRRWIAARARIGPGETVGGPSPDRVAVIGAL
jgi:Sigma-70 region 2